MNSQPGTTSPIFTYKKEAPISDENVLRIPEKNSLNFYVITKYVCALLNSKGGTLLLGVDSNFLVKGRKLNREDIDKFQRNIDEALKQFSPSVKGHEYSINFHPVVSEEGKKVAIRDIYVIEIRISNINTDDLYFTHFDECWIKKRDNQIDLVSITELKSYMDRHMNKSFETKREQLQKRLDLFEAKGIESLNRDALLKLKKDLETSLILIEKQKEYIAQSNKTS